MQEPSYANTDSTDVEKPTTDDYGSQANCDSGNLSQDIQQLFRLAGKCGWSPRKNRSSSEQGGESKPPFFRRAQLQKKKNKKLSKKSRQRNRK